MNFTPIPILARGGARLKAAPAEVPVTTVDVSPSSFSIEVGESQQLTATVENASGSTTWQSSDTGVATVGSSGLVSGVAEGSVTITATNNGVSGTSSGTVAEAVEPGEGVIASATFEDGTTGDFSWGGSSTHRTLEVVPDPTGEVGGNVVELGYDPGRGSDVDNYLARSFPYNGHSVGAGDTVFCYGKFFIVSNGYTGNRKIWRYYIGGQGLPGSDITIWHGSDLNFEGTDGGQNFYFFDTDQNVSRDEWHELEVQMTLDSSPGAGDGIFRVWLDRELVHENTAFTFTNPTYTSLSVVRFGYQTQSTRPENNLFDTRYWDDLVISTERVAP